MDIVRVFINRWVILGALALGGLLLVGALAFVNLTRTPLVYGDKPQIALTQFAAPSPTVLVPTLSPEPSATPAPTMPAPPSGTLPVGAYVQIVNTGGLGLNLRAAPSRTADINYLGLESEVFVIRGGPVEADDLFWYDLVGFSDATRSGWGASNYLEIIQNP